MSKPVGNAAEQPAFPNGLLDNIAKEGTILADQEVGKGAVTALHDIASEVNNSQRQSSKNNDVTTAAHESPAASGGLVTDKSAKEQTNLTAKYNSENPSQIPGDSGVGGVGG